VEGHTALSPSVFFLELLINLESWENNTVKYQKYYAPRTYPTLFHATYKLDYVQISQNFTTTLLQTNLTVFLQAVLERPKKVKSDTVGSGLQGRCGNNVHPNHVIAPVVRTIVSVWPAAVTDV
jgi:hypothetical protein